jgi:hypothetical protein
MAERNEGKTMKKRLGEVANDKRDTPKHSGRDKL